MNKMIIRVIAMLLAGVLILGIVSMVFAEEMDHVLTIKTPEEFLTFAENCRLDSYSQDLTVQLTEDIDLSGRDFEGIPIFCGSFYGNGHTVSGLSITGEGSFQGLFRYLTETAVVDGLTVSGTVKPTGSRSYVGGIAGSNAGTIQNCNAEDIKISGADYVGGLVGINGITGQIVGCSADGEIHGTHFVGGIAGENQGKILSCENNAHVNTTTEQNRVDISDITIDTIIGTETTITVTDLGGIAGTSSGSIMGCTNRGDVGYPYIGYNVGGIAGSQSGYLVGCTNYGAVNGRKEVGGILGQLEPYTTISFATDTLQILKQQVADLSVLTKRAAANAKENLDHISALVGRLEQYVADMESAADQLTAILEDPQIESLEDAKTTLETVGSLLETIGSCVAGIDETSRSLYSAIKDTGSSLGSDLEAVSQQVEAMESTLNHASDNLGGTVTDSSDQDTENDLHAKVLSCRNYGEVLSDLNAGGIVGAMAVESDLDPEKDLQILGENTLNYDISVRAVVRSCINSGAVQARKQHTGGIVGWMSMGLVADCVNTGSVEASGSSYVGGIAGSSVGFIRRCSAKCTLAGKAFVGGIAGEADTVTDCRSLVLLEDAGEKRGHILGFAEDRDNISGNFYVVVDKDGGAIDGISYDGCAQSMEWDAFLALEALPEQFSTVTLRFVFENGDEVLVELAPGDVLTEKMVPQLSAIPGKTGCWPELSSWLERPILFDRTFTAEYTAYSAVLSGGGQQNGLDVFLLEGSFPEGTELNLERWPDAPVLVDNAAASEVWKFAVTQDAQVSRGRFLLPQGRDTENLKLWVSGRDGWREAEFSMRGNYVIFDLQDGDRGFALVEKAEMDPTPVIVIAVVLIAVTAVTVTVIRIRKHKKRPQPVAAEGEE